MEDFNPRSPIRLSDIDNLLQESIFESSDGAKLVEYLKKKRGGGGRVRLQNIFQQVPVQRAQFNFNLDTTDPTPLPESPEPTTSNAARVPEIVAHNDVPEIAVTEAAVGDDGVVSPRVPIVMVNDFNAGKKVKQIALKSPGPMNALSRQVLINQYQRTNAAKCELLKQLASSTPKPDSNGSLGRMSTFTTSISPIVEQHSPMTPYGGEVIPSSQPQQPVAVMEIVVPPPASQEVILAPCSQAVTDCTPQKVVVLKTVVNPYGQMAIAEEVVIPETPSPAKVVVESPKAAPHPAQMQPRRLSTTFKQMESEEAAAAAAVFANGHITSDESDVEESPAGNSILLKSILKDTSMGGGRSRHSFRVSFSRQLVQQREISPAPDVPEANYNDSNSTDESDASDSDTDDNEYQVVDEVYTDDDGEDGVEAVDHQDEYDELKSRICELNKSHNGRRSVSPLIDVVKETPVQWFETTTPTKRRDEQAVEEQQFPPPTTAKKDNKTNLQLVDIITDWDDEEDDDEGDHSASNAEAEPSQQRVSEPRQSTNSNHHETNLDTMDISSSNLEDSIERLVELPPAPNALIEEEGVLPEEHIYPAAVDEQMPAPTVQITTEELVDVLTDDASDDAPEDSVVYEPQTQTPPEEEQRSETPPPVEQPVELPPPPETTAPEEPTSPERVITPPIQFTTSAKRRFIQQNEDELISRLQNDMPLSQLQSQSDTDLSELPAEEDAHHKTFEKVSETLVEIAASFRDQPATVSSMPPPSEANRTVNRTVVVQRKKGGKRSISTDPVTASYFEAIEKTFARPKAPLKQGGKKTDQKRKLYDATLSEVTEDEESMRVVKPVEVVAAVAAEVVKSQVEAPKLRELKVVVNRLRAEEYLSRKEPESGGQVVEVASTVVVAARKVGRPPSKDRSRAAKGDGPKRARGRPKKVSVDGERSLQAEVQTTPEESVLVNGVAEESVREEVAKKKHRPKEDEVLPIVNGSSKEVEVEPEVQQKKKKPKPNLAGSLDENQPIVNGSSKEVVVESESREDLVKQKKKKPKPNLAAVMQVSLPEQSPQKLSVAQDLPVEPSSESQQQRSDESLPAINGTSEHDSKQKKKKKLKPNLAALVQDSSPEASVARNSESQSQQRMDEILPAVNGSVEHEASEDKPREKKKRLKPNLAALSPVEPVEQVAKENGAKKKKLKPNLAALSPESATEPAVVAQVEPAQQTSKEDGAKKKKLKPNLAAVSPESAPEPVITPVELAQQTSKEDGAKKKKLKPNLAAVAQKSPPEPAVVVQVEPVEQVAKKKKLKPNLAKVSLEALPAEPPKETAVDQVATIAEKKKKPEPVVAQEPTVVQVEEPVEQSSKEVVTKKRKPKPNLAAASRESLPEPVITPAEPAQPVSKEDGTKKKRLKPNLPAVSPEVAPEPAVVERVEPVEQTSKEDGTKKKRLKPNLAAVSPESAPEPVVERVEPVEQVAKKKKLKPNLAAAPLESPSVQPTKETIVDQVATVTEKRKTKPNLEKVSQKSLPEPVVAQVELVEAIPTKSKQQHAEVEVRLEKDKPADRQRKQKSRASLNEVVPTTAAAVETATAEPKTKEPKVKLTKMDVAPMMQGSMSPASRAILLRAQIQPAASPRRLFADKLPGVAPLEQVQKEKKSDDARKKRPKSKAQPMDPIPKVRISAEKDGIYRITTPSKENPAQDSFDERLNVTESDNVRTSLEDNPEDFLGFEDNAENQDTAVDITMDLTRSFLEPVILLEPAKLPEGVEIQGSSNANRKPRRRSKSPAKRTPKKSREPRPARKSTDAASEPEMAPQPELPALENRSLPLKKRKSRDNSREVPAPPPPPPPPQQEPHEEVVLAGLNDSMLIPMLQRVPIADKYLVRSTPDRGTESTDYETDDTSSTAGDNVLIVRKDISRLDQSIAVDLEEEAERAANLNRKNRKRRESIPLPRFYGDNTFDLTWKPKSKTTGGAGASRKNKRRLDNDSGIEEEDVVRRSKRTCRISKQILMTNPYIKSAYDRPDYRPMTVEQLAEAEQIAKKLKEENTRRRKPRAVPAAPSKPKRTPSRKRPQEPTEVPEEQQAKRTRADSALDEPVPSTSAAAPCAEVAVQATAAVETILQEKQQAQSWMMKLMAENSGREEVMPQATSTGDRMHFQLDHLTYQERNGIQYSFFIYSETENFGFLRFAPAAVKKWTKTADFLLKFLVLHGQLSFQINGKETVTKGGDFLMLPQNTRYRIQNSEEISLVFMIKFKTAQSELPSM